MSGGAIIGFAITYIIYKINIYNTEILEQKEAINKISIISENLYISKILNHINNYNISYKYIIISIIIIIIEIIFIII